MEKKGVLHLEHREVFRRPERRWVEPAPPPALNEEQQTCLDGLESLLAAEKPECALLYGVTGSGKTQVYIRLIHSALATGKSALVLVPEIALTPQLLSLFSAQFGDEIALLHSMLPAGEPGQRSGGHPLRHLCSFAATGPHYPGRGTGEQL